MQSWLLDWGPKTLPNDVQLACPRDSDWTDSDEPYCNDCWEIESVILDEMIYKHKVIGKPTKKNVAKKKKKVVKNTELGGVRSPDQRPLLLSDKKKGGVRLMQRCQIDAKVSGRCWR